MRGLGTLVGLTFIFSALMLSGCHKTNDASAELANAVKRLEQSSPAPPSPPQTTPDSHASSSAAQQASLALTALKAGNYGDAISLMELARSNPGRTPSQTMVIQDAMAALMTDLYARAAKGDLVAGQAIKEYQENRNKR